MKKEYDFSKLKPVTPKYLKLLKESVTIRLDLGVINYFKQLAEDTGIPYQSLVNYVLREYADKDLKPTANWKGVSSKKKKAR